MSSYVLLINYFFSC